jgi:hypothetical protein
MIALGWLYWILYQLLSFFVFFPIGLVVLAPLAAMRMWYQRSNYSPMFPGRVVWAWKGGWLTFVFCNEEDGICGGVYPSPLAAYDWSAIRNFANNMRLLPLASITLKGPVTVKGRIVTYGWRQCIYFGNFRFGWLLPKEGTTGYRAWPVAG